MIAIDSDTLAFEIPPIIRLIKNITNKLDMDHVIYEINVPIITNIKTGFLPYLSDAAPITVDEIN